MSLLGEYWRKICEPLDGFLWHKDISHPIIRPLLRNEILACGFCVLLGAAAYAIFPWLFWFGCGILCMTWIFWSWARFFLRINPADFSLNFTRAVIIKFGSRLVLLAILLYVALALCAAPASAILAGLTAGVALALISYALGLARG